MKTKNIKTNDDKVVLEFDNINPSPLNTKSDDMEQKEGVDFTSTLFSNKPQSNSEKYTSKLPSVKSKVKKIKKKKPIHKTQFQEVKEQKTNDLDTILPSVLLPDNNTQIANLKNSKEFLMTIENPKDSQRYGGLGKKIAHLFQRTSKKNSSDISSYPTLRGQMKEPMSEMEKLEFEFNQKKLMLQKKQEEEEQKRVVEQRATIKQIAEEQQQKQDLERLRMGDIDQLTKKEIHTMLSGNGELKLSPFNIEEVKYCPKCHKKLKKGKIKTYDFTYIQELKCKGLFGGCGYSTERRIDV